MIGGVNAKAVSGVGQSVDGSKGRELPSVSFKEIMSGLERTSNSDIHGDLVKLSYAIQSGKDLAPKDLLFYQIRAGQFGLQVELASKLGESLTATIRKLEQGH